MEPRQDLENHFVDMTLARPTSVVCVSIFSFKEFIADCKDMIP